MSAVLNELGPPEHPDWFVDQAVVAHRDLGVGGVTIHFAVPNAFAHRSTIFALDEALALRPEAGEPVSEMSEWQPLQPEGQRRQVKSLGLTVTIASEADEDTLLTIDVIVWLAEDLLAARVRTALAGYRARKGRWEMHSVVRRTGGVTRPQLLDDDHIADAVVRRGRGDAVIKEAGG